MLNPFHHKHRTTAYWGIGRFLTLGVLVAFTVTAPASASFAQGDEPAQREPLADEPGTGQLERRSQPASKRNTAFDEELFDRLIGRPSTQTKDDGDPLERAIQRMRSAQQRLQEQDTGDETRTIQREIVDDLEKLIEQAKQSKQKPPQSPPPQQPMDDDTDPSGQPDSQDAQDDQDESATENAQGSEPGRNRQDEKAEESTDQAEEGTFLEVERNRRRELVKDVWGHLPPQLREELLNISGDKYLPKYEELIRLYFEALADPESSRSDR